MLKLKLYVIEIYERFRLTFFSINLKFVLPLFPGVPPRNPKVSVPLSSPLQQNQSSNSNNQYIVHHGHNGFNGAKPRFLSSSPAAKKMHPNNVVLSPSKMNLSAIHSAVSPGATITGACVLTRQTINICFYYKLPMFFTIFNCKGSVFNCICKYLVHLIQTTNTNLEFLQRNFVYLLFE